jgi:agmatinase
MHRVVSEIPAVAKLVSAGVRDFSHEEYRAVVGSGGRVQAFFDVTVARELSAGVTFADIAARVAAALPRDVYVSFDIDGLDPALCPHTGTPVVGGLSFAEAVCLLRTLVQSGRRVVGFDLNEVAPDPSGRSEWDGNVGARVLYKEIGFALMSRAS